MKAVSPLKDPKKIELLKFYLKNKNHRDYLLFIFGINTNLRISDLLSLKKKDVYNGKKIKDHIELVEGKTKKRKKIKIAENLEKAIKEYLKEENLTDGDYLFKSKSGKPISRQQAHNILQQAGDYCGIDEPISPHTLRKTWAYHAWKAGVSPVLLMEALNHSSIQITKRYIGITQEELDEIYVNINL